MTAGCPCCVSGGLRSLFSHSLQPFSTGRWCNQHHFLEATWRVYPCTCQAVVHALSSPPVGQTLPAEWALDLTSSWLWGADLSRREGYFFNPHGLITWVLSQMAEWTLPEGYCLLHYCLCKMQSTLYYISPLLTSLHWLPVLHWPWELNSPFLQLQSP